MRIIIRLTGLPQTSNPALFPEGRLSAESYADSTLAQREPLAQWMRSYPDRALMQGAPTKWEIGYSNFIKRNYEFAGTLISAALAEASVANRKVDLILMDVCTRGCFYVLGQNFLKFLKKVRKIITCNSDFFTGICIIICGKG